MKQFEILQLSKCDTETGSDKCYWEYGTSRLAWERVPTNLQLTKKCNICELNKVKHNKTKHACEKESLAFADMQLENGGLFHSLFR